ncbi:hypothetical protein Zmor_024128 [Zophobas morio]|uniref:Uncharacterized protein n=1 Tax=Zophobas morio TaxID=2755281 RepID=A0AA38HXZ8_9CUCU|nr:hypothetical protein Zmor_024127 [Zophobas morio]KAJ3646544.1 hypothetical protein Zmor_024128 [Zophobas morio]
MINNSWTRKNPFPNNRDSFVYGVDQVFFHGAPAHVHAARTERGETRIYGPFRDYAVAGLELARESCRRRIRQVEDLRLLRQAPRKLQHAILGDHTTKGSRGDAEWSEQLVYSLLK